MAAYKHPKFPDWLKFVEIGDVLTHTRCGGDIQEHYYRGMNGWWICGTATPDTRRIEKISRADAWTNDISPNSVTHINRTKAEYFLSNAQGQERKKKHDRKNRRKKSKR